MAKRRSNRIPHVNTFEREMILQAKADFVDWSRTVPNRRTRRGRRVLHFALVPVGRIFVLFEQNSADETVKASSVTAMARRRVLSSRQSA